MMVDEPDTPDADIQHELGRVVALASVLSLSLSPLSLFLYVDHFVYNITGILYDPHYKPV